MLLHLPAFNTTLSPCPVGLDAFTVHPKGHFCGSCQRVVQDFSKSQNPVAELAAARAASPDGRVCGSFHQEQVAASPRLTQRLKWFVVALVLVVGHGFTAQEALAQVRKPVPENMRMATRATTSEALPMPAPSEAAPVDKLILGMMMETMPTFQGGGNRAIVDYIQKRVVWPQHNGKMVNAQGRLFASFTVGTDGQVRNVEIVKTFNPLFNESVLEVIRAMRGFKPGLQNGKPVAVSMTVPISFKLK